MPKTRTGIPKRALGRIQRLCCLGVTGEATVPELLRELGPLVPFRWAAFRWLGPDFQLTKVYSTSPARLHELYLHQFSGRRERETCCSMAEIMRTRPKKAVTDRKDHLKVSVRDYTRSDYFNLVIRPSGCEEMIQVLVREHECLFAVLCLGRLSRDAPFSSAERTALETISVFIAHGMSCPPTMETEFSESDDRASVIADRNGRILYASGRGLQLLSLVLTPDLASATNLRLSGQALPELASLCRKLAATADGVIGEGPPIWHCRNPWGEFVLRAYWLEPTDGVEQMPHLGVSIERLVPRRLALLRRVEALPLTGREKQLCLLLAGEERLEELAGTMGLSRGTVITHQRSIYAKLGVHSRAGLLAMLHRGVTPARAGASGARR